MGFPPAVALARPAAAIRARGVTELLAASRQELPRRFAKALPVKAVSDAVPCAFAHDRQTFPFGEPWGARGRSPQTRMTGKRPLMGNAGGKGAKPPKPKRWRCGSRGERARARAFPNGTEAPAAKRRGVRPIRIAQRDLGVSKGGRPAPHFGPGIRKGVKLPCACLCLLSAGAESRGPRAA